MIMGAKVIRVAHHARPAARVRLFHSPHTLRLDSCKCSCSRHRWRMLQPRVSALEWFFSTLGLRSGHRHHCSTVDGVKGCCKNGRTCGGNHDEAPVCQKSGYLRCAKETFCCRKPALFSPTIPVLCVSIPSRSFSLPGSDSSCWIPV